MTESLGKRVLERVRRRKLALEAETSTIVDKIPLPASERQAPAEAQPDPVLNAPESLAGIPQVDYRPSPESRAEYNKRATQAAFTNRRVVELCRRWKAGHFDGVSAKLHLGKTDNLTLALKGYLDRKKLLAAEPDDLLKIAETVLELIPEAKL